jgi:hypothetical protein
MRKIIGFKLVLRAHEIKRRAKKAKLDLDALGLGQDPVLQKRLDEVAALLAPGVLFETFKHPDPDADRLSPMPGLAYSLILATLGREEPAAEPLWSLLRAAALDETVRFAASLLSDEAAKDVCELSPINPLSGTETLQTVLRKLEGSKVGVSLEEGALKPTASAAVSLSWLSKSKAKGKSK